MDSLSHRICKNPPILGGFIYVPLSFMCLYQRCTVNLFSQRKFQTHFKIILSLQHDRVRIG